jgi:pyridoxal phosphate enzyme (YggS family)
LPLEDPAFQSRLRAVEVRIEDALLRSGRKRSEVTLVAVTKKFSADRVQQAYDAGLRDFGENYVQEFAAKFPLLRPLAQARFHLIGHLQSNKVRTACELFQVIETVDSAKILKRIDAIAKETNVNVEAFLEVKLSDESNKTGASPDEIPGILEAAVSCERVRVSGLMTLPPWSEDAEKSRTYFRKLALLARKFQLPNLSMGMSGDFEIAIEEGATVIRVGTALFGRRPRPDEAAA